MAIEAGYRLVNSDTFMCADVQVYSRHGVCLSSVCSCLKLGISGGG